ncbi:threonine-rich protein-like [Acropora millepora]|uniref:threonine-rich protein-like n=1 Tax=Acropora millepora TaxID=45264 RepID=UPI001CF56EF1|nr:threonine-rich protein-like [Acropora millepora]
MKVLLLSLMILFACIVLTESAPHSADIGAEAFEELVRNYLQAVQRDSHMANLTCAECQGVTERICTLAEREVQCNPGEVCTTLEAFNLGIGTTTVTRGCFNITGLNCDDNPGCDALNTTGNIQSCDQFCCNISLCNSETPQTTDGGPATDLGAPTTTKAPTTTETRIPLTIARTTFPCKYLAVVTILAIVTILIPF